ncbi:hypothetical protein ABE10_25425, partial [Bacillus toyonensis]|nr:hypothetical protein [Bacillus toyonensis]
LESSQHVSGARLLFDDAETVTGVDLLDVLVVGQMVHLLLPADRRVAHDRLEVGAEGELRAFPGSRDRLVDDEERLRDQIIRARREQVQGVAVGGMRMPSPQGLVRAPVSGAHLSEQLRVSAGIVHVPSRGKGLSPRSSGGRSDGHGDSEPQDIGKGPKSVLFSLRSGPVRRHRVTIRGVCTPSQ